jgi:hypothetical protein
MGRPAATRVTPESLPQFKRFLAVACCRHGGTPLGLFARTHDALSERLVDEAREIDSIKDYSPAVKTVLIFHRYGLDVDTADHKIVATKPPSDPSGSDDTSATITRPTRFYSFSRARQHAIS